jgi:hypothetical protein
MKRFLLSLLLLVPGLAIAHAPEGAGGGFLTGFFTSYSRI